MCWSEPVSWITLIIGTIFNIISVIVINKPIVIATSIIWQFALLMQFFDALIWRDQKCGKLNKFATKGAYISNMLQPIVAFIVLIFITKSSMVYKGITGTLVTVYIAYILLKAKEMKNIECVKPICGHLNYDWWNNMKGGGLLYVITLVSVVLLLSQPFLFGVMESSYILLTLLVSMIVYKKTVPSMWCWMAAFAPLFTIIFYKISSHK